MFHPSKWSNDFKIVYDQEVDCHGYMAMEFIYITEGGINAMTRYMSIVAELLENKLIVDRANKINNYKYFNKISKMKFPYLNSNQVKHLADQYKDIRKAFPFRPSETYLAKREFR